MKKILLSVFCIIISLTTIQAQFTSIPVSKREKTDEGIIYALPKTLLEIKVKTKTITGYPGKYYPYAERFLGLKNVYDKKTVTKEIESIIIKTKAIPDKNNTYIFKSKSSSIALTNNGIIKSVNHNEENSSDPNINANTSIKYEKDDSEKYDYVTKPYSIYTREIEQSTSLVKSAELAANEIYSIRDTRNDLLNQNIEKGPADGESYKIILSELNRIEEYYMQLFTGVKKEKTDTKTIYVDPKEGENLLFRFSEKFGIVDNNDLSGSPIYINIKIINTPTNYFNNSPDKDVSLYYKMPVKATIELYDNYQKALYKNIISISQFGETAKLTAGFNGYVIINPKTGALIKTGKR